MGFHKQYRAITVVLALATAIGCQREQVEVPPTDAVNPDAVGLDGPVVSRGEVYWSGPEQFNRIYTQPNWTPSRTLYVSASGSASPTSSSVSAPGDVANTLSIVRPGDEVVFVAADGEFNGCYELDDTQSGTYEEPIVLRAEEGVQMHCCTEGRASCFNLEGADYIGILGFEFIGGDYGIRSVGLDVESTRHQRGIAMIGNIGHDQWRDPFFTGQSDWTAIEGNVAFGAQEGDGHGIYVSNGSDWVVLRRNELYGNSSSDLQVNADPIYSCDEQGVDYDDEACWGRAEDGMGQGVSEYIWVEGNFFHDGAANGPNFTSMRDSVVRNNIFGPYQQHGVSFWQETNVPALGSSNNKIESNLFVGTSKWDHALQLIEHAVDNEVFNNVLIGVDMATGAADPEVLLFETDSTSQAEYAGNIYISGYVDTPPGDFDLQRTETFSPGWFTGFPGPQSSTLSGWTPTQGAPFGQLGGWQPPEWD